MMIPRYCALSTSSAHGVDRGKELIHLRLRQTAGRETIRQHDYRTSRSARTLSTDHNFTTLFTLLQIYGVMNPRTTPVKAPTKPTIKQLTTYPMYPTPPTTG